MEWKWHQKSPRAVAEGLGGGGSVPIRSSVMRAQGPQADVGQTDTDLAVSAYSSIWSKFM
jgi:hypothetical protein